MDILHHAIILRRMGFCELRSENRSRIHIPLSPWPYIVNPVLSFVNFFMIFFLQNEHSWVFKIFLDSRSF